MFYHRFQNLVTSLCCVHILILNAVDMASQCGIFSNLSKFLSLSYLFTPAFQHYFHGISAFFVLKNSIQLFDRFSDGSAWKLRLKINLYAWLEYILYRFLKACVPFYPFDVWDRLGGYLCLADFSPHGSTQGHSSKEAAWLGDDVFHW